MNVFNMLTLSKHIPKHVCNNSRLLIFPSQKLCSASFPHADYKHREKDSKMPSETYNNLPESDNFGTLEESLEKRARSRRNLLQNTEKLREKKIVKVQRPQDSRESDVFGNLSDKSPVWYPDVYEKPVEDNDLSDDSVIVKNTSRKYRCPVRILKEMKRFVKEKRIKEALDMFVEMRRNFVIPTHVHYTYMIGVCGKIGYTEMAFKLLRQMTDRSYQPTPATLTGLFNACAESPFPEYGLKKARLLKEKIESKNWLLSQITYHSMIKAFGKCGDLKTAFEIVDNMAKADVKIDVSTYSFLLMSCVANKEAGFTYAVEVWRKMKSKKCLPNIYTCNLLLRATRDCNAGPEEISNLLLQHWSSYSKRPYGFITKESISQETVLQLKSGQGDSVSKFSENTVNPDEMSHNKNFGNSTCNEEPKYELQKVMKTNIVANVPETSTASLLSARPVNGPEILELINIKNPCDRLSLFGGMDGFLEFMSSAKVKPSIKTFTLLLECLPDDTKEEEKLLVHLENHQVKPDIAFFNVLIKRRNFRHETVAAKDVLVLISQYELMPNIMTFGVLALGCRNKNQATIFVSEMEKMKATLNIEIAGSMLRNACVSLDFSYLKYVLQLIEKEQIKPNEKILLLLNKTLSDVRKNIILMEQGKNVVEFYQRDNLKSDFKEFSKYYTDWLKRMKFESEQHPWLQYKTDIIDRAKKEENPLWEIEGKMTSLSDYSKQFVMRKKGVK